MLRSAAATLALAFAATATATAQTTLAPQAAPTFTIPASAGYAHPDPNAMQRRPDGTVPKCDGSLRIYFDVATAGDLTIALARTADAPACTLRVTCGRNEPDAPCAQADVPLTAGQTNAALGTFPVTPGAHVIILSTNDGTPLRGLASLALGGDAAKDLHANTRERRNAASVHLGYPVPKEARDDVEWFYVEVTPKTDPVWTYYMATGWHRGYFGMQVNSASERRVIFSVWDAGSEAKDRGKVAGGDRVSLVAKGEGVEAGDFGNEGTGGHSHLVHDWKLGCTFRFLLHARVDGDATIYSGWFWFAAAKQWGLIASFRAPKDGKSPHGLYSFSENFHGANGDQLRECEFGNAWVRTTKGEWLPLQRATFTHDETGTEARRDRCAGVRDGRFLLRHGDFRLLPEGAVTKAREGLEVATAGQHPTDAGLPTPPQPPAKNR